MESDDRNRNGRRDDRQAAGNGRPHRAGIWARNPDVVARRIGQGMVLINLCNNQIYELNATGARIWELLAEGCDRPAILARLQDEFEVDGPVAAAGIDDTIAQLSREGLVRE